MVRKRFLQRALDYRFALFAVEQQVAAGDKGSRTFEAEVGGHPLEIVHLKNASANVHRPKQCDIGHHAALSRREACARASSVIEAPESIRAISSRRSSAESLRTVVRVPSDPCVFSIR